MNVKIKNIWLHLRKIQTHRKWVRHYCFGIGLYKQGLLHDLSKYSPTEFWESVKYYQGTSSPIDASKAENGYSMAWFHHRGRNLHHHVMWIDNFDEMGGVPILMPYKYFAEMICDYLAAGRAYMGADFSFAAENNWWKRKSSKGLMMPENQVKMISYIFELLEVKEQTLGTELTEKWFCKRGGRTLISFIYDYYKEHNVCLD